MDALNVTLHNVTVGEGVMTVAAHVSLLDAVVQHDADVDLAVAVANQRNTFGRFFCRKLRSEIVNAPVWEKASTLEQTTTVTSFSLSVFKLTCADDRTRK